MATTQTIPKNARAGGADAAIKRLLVATDFSEHADAALKWAIELASQHQAQIVLVHAIDTELPALGGDASAIDRYVRLNLTRNEDFVKAQKLALRAERHIGKPWIVVPRLARDVDADLVILGAHGKSTFSQRFLGRVAHRVIKTSPVPVIVVRPGSRPTTHGPRTILVATDFSEEGALATSAAVRLLKASPEKGRIVLFHTITMPVDYSQVEVPMAVPQFWDDLEKDAAKQLEGVAGPLRSDRITVEVKTDRGYPAESILRHARVLNVDLIAMGTQGRSGLGRFFMGSVAERVLTHAVCPVLTVRQPGPDEPIRLSAQ